MRKSIKIFMLTLCCLCVTVPPHRSEAAIPLAILEVIKAGIKKVIKAVDLKIQRQQNKVIWLQNAQKVLENALSKLKLEEISAWGKKQKQQYQKYFDELRKVKIIISYYQRIKAITETQAAIVQEYSRVWRVISADQHFTVAEIAYMGKVYSGILEQTVDNIDKLMLVVSAFRTQMSDAARLEMISEVAESVDQNYSDLKTFSTENALLSLSRANSLDEIDRIKAWYGIQ